MKNSNIKQISLKEVIQKETGSKFNDINQVKCPFHDEENASFSLYEERGLQLFKCFSCGKQGDLINFIEQYKNLKFKEAIFYLKKEYGLIDYDKKETTKKNIKQKPDPVIPFQDERLDKADEEKNKWQENHYLKTVVCSDFYKNLYGQYKTFYTYRNKKGQGIYVVVRFEKNQKKNTIPFYYSKSGWRPGQIQKILKQKGIEYKKTLFNLDLIKQNPKKKILFVEGEKCASINNGMIENYVLTTTGSSNFKSVDFNLDILKNKEIIIMPDNDPENKKNGKRPGIQYAKLLETALRSLAKKITILEPAGKENGYDIADLEQEKGLAGVIAYLATAKELQKETYEQKKETYEQKKEGTHKKITFTPPLHNIVPKEQTLNLLLSSFEKTEKSFETLNSHYNINLVVKNDENIRNLVAYDTAINDYVFHHEFTHIKNLKTSTYQYFANHYNITLTNTTLEHLIEHIATLNKHNSISTLLFNITQKHKKTFELGIKAAEETEETKEDQTIKNNPLIELFEYIDFDLKEDPEYEKCKIGTDLYDYTKHPFFFTFNHAFLRQSFRILQGNGRENLTPIDIMPILIGTKGNEGKGLFIKYLALNNNQYYTELITSKLDSTDNETTNRIRGKLFVEISEVDSMKKTAIEATKGFLSMATIERRKLYTEGTVQQPRYSILIGTSNPKNIINDDTNRRFFPIFINEIKRELFYTNINERIFAYYLGYAKKRYETVKKQTLKVEELRLTNSQLKWIKNMSQITNIFKDDEIFLLEKIKEKFDKMIPQADNELDIRPSEFISDIYFEQNKKTDYSLMLKLNSIMKKIGVESKRDAKGVIYNLKENVFFEYYNNIF